MDALPSQLNTATCARPDSYRFARTKTRVPVGRPSVVETSFEFLSKPVIFRCSANVLPFGFCSSGCRCSYQLSSLGLAFLLLFPSAAESSVPKFRFQSLQSSTSEEVPVHCNPSGNYSLPWSLRWFLVSSCRYQAVHCSANHQYGGGKRYC